MEQAAARRARALDPAPADDNIRDVVATMQPTTAELERLKWLIHTRRNRRDAAPAGAVPWTPHDDTELERLETLLHTLARGLC